jgi:hypothetical protein
VLDKYLLVKPQTSSLQFSQKTNFNRKDSVLFWVCKVTSFAGYQHLSFKANAPLFEEYSNVFKPIAPIEVTGMKCVVPRKDSKMPKPSIPRGSTSVNAELSVNP